jgi:hypothetical protein
MDNLQQWTKTFAFVFGLMASNAALCQTRTVEFEDGNKLEKVVDALGREVNHTTNQILFYIYDDGSVEKKFIVD